MKNNNEKICDEQISVSVSSEERTKIEETGKELRKKQTERNKYSKDNPYPSQEEIGQE